jgi:hypothetical protein
VFFVEAKSAHLVHDAADAGIELDDRIGILTLGHGLMDVVRVRHVRLMHLHEIDAHEEALRRPRVAIEIVEGRLLDIGVEEGNADHALLAADHGRVDILAVDLESQT